MPNEKYAFDIYSYRGRPSTTNGCSQRLMEGTYEEALLNLKANLLEEGANIIHFCSLKGGN